MEANRSSERNGFTDAVRREHAEQFVHASEYERSVVEYLARPRKLRLDERLQQEERPPEAERFPALRERAAALAGLDDDGRVRDERHGAVASREVPSGDGAAGRELGDEQVLLADSLLERGVRLRTRCSSPAAAATCSSSSTAAPPATSRATLGPDDRALFRTSLLLGVGVDPNAREYGPGDFVIRDVGGLQRETNGIFVPTELAEYAVVRFHLRDARGAIDDLEGAFERWRARGRFAPEGALMISGVGRGEALHGAPNPESDAFCAAFGAGVPVAGCFGGGEIAAVAGRTIVQRHTRVVAMFGGLRGTNTGLTFDQGEGERQIAVRFTSDLPPVRRHGHDECGQPIGPSVRPSACHGPARPSCYDRSMSPDVRAAIRSMSREERLELLDELWALVRDERLSVPESQVEELDRRAEAAERDGLAGDDWATVRERLRRSS